MNIDRKSQTAQFFDTDGRFQAVPLKDLRWAFINGENSMILTDHSGRRYEAYSLPESSLTFLDQIQRLDPDIITGAPCGLRYEMESMKNTRDLGGYPTRNGKYVRPGFLIRSSCPQQASDTDYAWLRNTLKLRTLLDLRSPVEVFSRKPFRLHGMTYVHIPPDLDFPIEVATRSAWQNPEGSPRIQKAIEKWYADLAVSRRACAAWSKIFDLLLQKGTAPILFFCTQGKDRTGILSYLLLLALDVDEQTAREDYLRSDSYLNDDWNALKKNLSIQDGSRLEGLHPIFQARSESLDAMRQAIWNTYGSMENYFRTALNMSEEKQKQLQKMYTI